MMATPGLVTLKPIKSLKVPKAEILEESMNKTKTSETHMELLQELLDFFLYIVLIGAENIEFDQKQEPETFCSE